MSDLKLNVKLDAPQIEIKGLQDKIQAAISALPVKVKLDLDAGVRDASRGVERLVTEYSQLSGILRQVNADRTKLSRLSITTDADRVEVYTKNIRRLSDEMSKLLGITSGAGRDRLFDYLKTGDTAGLADSLRRAGVETGNIIALLSQQVQAQHKVDQASATAAQNVEKAEAKKQAAIEATNQKLASSHWQSKFKESIEQLTKPNVDLKPLNDYFRQLESQSSEIGRQLATAEARLGGDYFKSTKDAIRQIGGDPERIKEVTGLLSTLESTYKRFVSSARESDDVTPVFLDRMLESERVFNESFTNLRKTATSTNTELTRSATADRAVADLGRYFQENERGIRRNSVLLEGYIALQNKIKEGGFGDLSVDQNLNKLQAEIAGFKKIAQEAGAEADTLSDRMKKLFGAHLGTAAIMFAINSLRKSLIDVWQNVKNLDAAIVNLQIASGKSRTEVQGLMRDYSALGKAIGATTTEVAQAADGWLRQGYSMQEVNKLIEDSAMLSKLGKISSEEATTALTSAMKGYGIAVEDATTLVDKFVAVDMKAAASAGGLAKSLQETAVSARLAGIPLDRMIGYIAKITEVTQDSPEAVGTFMKSMLARMGNIKRGRLIDPETEEDISDVESVLGSLGIKLRENAHDWRDFSDVLDDVNAKWSTYSDTQRRAIANAFGLRRNQEKFLVLMENYRDALDLANVSAESGGTAIEKYGAYTGGLEAHLNSLKAAFESLSSTVLNSDSMKGFIDGLTGIVSAFDTIASVAGTLPAIFAAANAGLGLFGRGIVGDKGLFRFFDIDGVQKFGRAWITKDELSVLSSISDEFWRALAANTKYKEGTISLAEAIGEARTGSIAFEEVMKSGSAAQQAAARSINGTTGEVAKYAGQVRNWGGILKNVFANLAVSAISTAVGIGINYVVQKIIDPFKDAAEAAAKANQEFEQLSSTLSENSKEMESNISRIEELRKKLDTEVLSAKESYDIRAEILEVQGAIIDKYGLEGDAIDLLTGKIDEQTESYRALVREKSKSEAQKWADDNFKAVEDAERFFSSEVLGSGSRFDFLSLDDAVQRKIKDVMSQYADSLFRTAREPGPIGTAVLDRHQAIFQPTGTDRKEAIAAYTEMAQVLQELESSGYDVGDALKAVRTELAYIKTDDYQGFVDVISKGIEVKITLSDTYAGFENSVAEIREAYTRALASGDVAAQGRALEDLRAISGEIYKIDNKEVRDRLLEPIVKLSEDLKKHSLYVDIKANFEGYEGLRDAFKGMTADEIMNLEFGDGTEKQIAAFEELSAWASKMGVSVKDLATAWVAFGAIQRETTGYIAGTSKEFATLQELIFDKSDESQKKLSEVSDALRDFLDFRSDAAQMQRTADVLSNIMGYRLPRDFEQATIAARMLKAYIDGGVEGFRDYTAAQLEAFGIKVDTKNIQGAISTLIASLGTLKGEALATAQAILLALTGTGLVRETQTFATDIKPYSSRGYTDTPSSSFSINESAFKKYNSALADATKSSSKGGGGKTQADTWLEEYQHLVKELEFLRDTDVLSEAEYYRRLEALAVKYLKGREKYVEEYRKVVVDLYGFEKKYLEDQLKDELDKAKEVYEDIASAAEDSFDAVKRAADLAFAEQKDGFTDALGNISDFAAQKKAGQDYYETLADAAKTSHENQSQSAKDYYDAQIKAADLLWEAQQRNLKDPELLKQAAEAYYKTGKDAAEEYYRSLRKLADESYNRLKDAARVAYDANKKAAEDSYNAQRDAAEEAYKAQRKALEKQKELLNEQLDAYSELINLRKRLLRDESDARSFDKDVAESNKRIADIQAEIDALALDNSAKANAKRKQLQENLIKEQESLEDKQYDRSVDMQERALDDEYDRYKKSVDAQLKLLDGQIDALADAHEKALKVMERTHKAFVNELSTNYDLLIRTLDAEYAATLVTLRDTYDSTVLTLQNTLTAFITDLGIKFDGLLSKAKETAAAISREFDIVYAKGQSAAAIAQTQQQLIDSGFSVGKTGVDGIFGKNTELAYVKAWQTYLNSLGANLKVDGIRGSDTRAAEKKYNVSFPVYHKGGIVGDGIDQSTEFKKIFDLRPDEILARLQKREVVLTEEQQTNIWEALKGSLNPSNVLGRILPKTAMAPVSGGYGAGDGVTVETNIYVAGAPDASVVQALIKERDSLTNSIVREVHNRVGDRISNGPGYRLRGI